MMLQALHKLSGSIQQTVQSIENALDPSRGKLFICNYDVSLLLNLEENYKHQVQVFKELLVETQFEHVKMSRSLEQLIGENQAKIKQLVRTNTSENSADELPDDVENDQSKS